MTLNWNFKISIVLVVDDWFSFSDLTHITDSNPTNPRCSLWTKLCRWPPVAPSRLVRWSAIPPWWRCCTPPHTSLVSCACCTGRVGGGGGDCVCGGWEGRGEGGIGLWTRESNWWPNEVLALMACVLLRPLGILMWLCSKVYSYMYDMQPHSHALSSETRN